VVAVITRADREPFYTTGERRTLGFLKGAAQLSLSLSELGFEFLRQLHDWKHFSVTQGMSDK
jgi:hypothetical protein